ncbi:DUF732 domain-containing protein [Rhodococcus sp. WMMA185]|uniref:DUF732 domain-containing protein n=1 Tax=Rhodococcus sp. WMMA185 TaxID=679318 RepID=UPI0008784BB6|nr:DUF732 domain-containing protein [Rhodococcus sp. WMMA185]AOW93789.1 DUF732 domain-containing protein [Rhodococcus sp. WMMA185]
MAQHSRIGTIAGRKVAIGAMALAAAGLLAACGSDDVTATSTPSASTTTSAAESADEGAAADAPDAPDAGESTPAPVTSPGEAATAPPSEPEALPEDFPGPDQVPVSGDGQRFLDALRDAGIEPSGDGSTAISTADFICQAEAEGQSGSVTMVFVTAMVGTEASAAGRQLTDEQAAADAQTYVDVANATYCK